MITKFKIFEDQIRDILNFNPEKPENHIDIIKHLNYQKKDFKFGSLLEDIFIHKPFDKRIHLIWNHHTNVHDFKERIRDRTDYRSVSEFNDMIIEVIKYLFEERLLKGNGFQKYGIILDESKLDFIISFNHDDLKKYVLPMTIRTVGYTPKDCEIIILPELDIYLKTL